MGCVGSNTKPREPEKVDYVSRLLPHAIALSLLFFRHSLLDFQTPMQEFR